jgi:large subunit ribosomal protein L18
MKKLKQEQKRKLRNRIKIRINNDRPRLSVYRSNSYVYAQIIDDKTGNTLAHTSSLKMKEKGIKAAEKVGALIAEMGKKAKVNKVIFDRGAYKYHGVVKALADSARNNGLEF